MAQYERRTISSKNVGGAIQILTNICVIHNL